MGGLGCRKGWSGLERLRPEPSHCPWWGVVALCIIAVVVGVLVRTTWINWADQVDVFKWNGQLQPTTQDAFFHGSAIIRYGEGGLQGVTEAMPLLNHHGVIHLAGIAMRSLGWMTTDQIVLWFPVVLGSLIAVPVILIGRRLGNTWMGFGAALLAVVAANYYERTMAGYYDHDMLSVASVGMIVWLLMEVDARVHRGWLLAAALSVFFFPLIYTKGIAIVVAVVGFWLITRLAIARDLSTLVAVSVMIIALALSPLSNGNRIYAAPWMWFAALFGVIAAWWWLSFRTPSRRAGFMLFTMGLVAAVILFPWDMVLYQLQAYLKIGDVGSLANGRYAEVSFRAAHKASILEAQHIPIEEIAWRIIGASWLVVIAAIGLGLACAGFLSATVLLPLAGVALFAIPGGLRFTTWGTIPAAIGVAYVVFLLLRLLLWNVQSARWKSCLGIAVGTATCAALAWPSLSHARAFKVAPVFSHDDIKIFKAIEAQSAPNDLVLGWWDYGTGVWYYADRDVLVHPALVTDDAVAVSRILTSTSQREAAVLSRALAAANEQGHRPAFHAVLDAAGFGPDLSARDALAAMTSVDEQAHELESDVYLYMPLQEVRILTPISTFSRDQLHQGELPPPSLVAGAWADLRGLGSGWIGSMQGRIAVEANTGQPGLIGRDGRVSPVRFASVTSIEVTDDGMTHLGRADGGKQGPWVQADANGLTTSANPPEASSRLHLLLLPSAKTMIVVNDAALKTNAIQMGVLGLIDETLFEQVHASVQGRVFRVRHKSDQADAATRP